MIVIAEVDAGKAALQVANLLDAKHGQWWVNAIDDDGFLVAREGSPMAARLKRSGAPTVVGPFNHRWSVCYIAQDMRAAQKGDKLGCARTLTPAKRLPKSRLELRAWVIENLGDGEKQAHALAADAGVSEETMRAVLRGMKSMRVVKVRRSRLGFNSYSLTRSTQQVAA